MNRNEMIKFIKSNPNVKVTHKFFEPNEYIVLKQDGKVYTEKGYLFEDWKSIHNCGIRTRMNDGWENDWKIWNENEMQEKEIQEKTVININGKYSEKKVLYLEDMLYYISEGNDIELAVNGIEITVSYEANLVRIYNGYIDCTMSIEDYRKATAIYDEEKDDYIEAIRLFDFKNGEWDNIIKWSEDKREIGTLYNRNSVVLDW